MLRLSMGYPSHEDEIEILRRRQNGIRSETVQQVVDREGLLQIQRETDQVFIKDELLDYIVSLCEKTRQDPRILQGASPRASLALTSLAKATAWIQGRDYVLPRDIRFIFKDCIAHRLIWATEFTDSSAKDIVLSDLFSAVKAPAIK